MGEVLGNAKAEPPGGAASSPLTTKARPICHFILLELAFKKNRAIILQSYLLSFGLCAPPLEGANTREGWLHMCVTGSRAMQSNIRLSLPQHPYPPGSPKQCQDLSTWQMRAQEHSLAIGLSVTLPNPSPEQRDAGSSYCETLELHCRALSEPGRAAGGCFIISAICLFALPSSAPPGYAHTYLFSKSFAGSQ